MIIPIKIINITKNPKIFRQRLFVYIPPILEISNNFINLSIFNNIINTY